MENGSNGALGGNCYALVTYIPDPLGRFLDDLRRQLVPGCDPHAHVTLMPPRPINGTPEQAWEQIFEHTVHIPAFELAATEVRVFPKTNVVYIDVGKGREQLFHIHSALNREHLKYDEPFPYHPHITLGQELPLEYVLAAEATAHSLWADFPHSRTFAVEELTFVQNICGTQWKDLASVQLPRVGAWR